MAKQVPVKLEGIRFIDDRGVLKAWHFPDHFKPQRFYTVNNWTNGFIRAWHGHLKEAKIVFVSKGAGLVSCVEMLDPDNPIKNSEIHKFVIDENSTFGIFIPPKYANGMKSLTEDCEFQIFSNSTLEESKNDDFRFPFDFWPAWDVEQR